MGKSVMQLIITEMKKRYENKIAELENEILDFEDWKETQGYRNEYDED